MGKTALTQTERATREKYSVHHIVNPDELSDSQREWIVSSLIDQFPDLKMKEYFDLKPNWFVEFDELVYAIDPHSDSVVGLFCACWYELPYADATSGNKYRLLHATTQFIAPQWQGSMMLRDIWRVFLTRAAHSDLGFPDLIVLKTCNPLAYKPMRKFALVDGVELYPPIPVVPISEIQKKLAESIAALISPGHEFDVETGIILDVSTPRNFYPELPPGKPGSELSNYFHKHLTCNDRILCITHVRTSSARSIILNAFGVS